MSTSVEDKIYDEHSEKLIDAFIENRELWDPALPANSNRASKEEIWKNIAASLKLEPKMAFSKFSKLHVRFKRMSTTDLTGTPDEILMKFASVDAALKRHKKGDDSHISEGSDCSDTPISIIKAKAISQDSSYREKAVSSPEGSFKTNLRTFASRIRDEPILWNKLEEDFNNKDKRREKWNEIGRDFKVTGEVAYRYFNKYRTRYMQSLKDIKAGKKVEWSSMKHFDFLMHENRRKSQLGKSILVSLEVPSKRTTSVAVEPKDPLDTPNSGDPLAITTSTNQKPESSLAVNETSLKSETSDSNEATASLKLIEPQRTSTRSMSVNSTTSVKQQPENNKKIDTIFVTPDDPLSQIKPDVLLKSKEFVIKPVEGPKSLSSVQPTIKLLNIAPKPAASNVNLASKFSIVKKVVTPAINKSSPRLIKQPDPVTLQLPVDKNSAAATSKKAGSTMKIQESSVITPKMLKINVPAKNSIRILNNHRPIPIQNVDVTVPNSPTPAKLSKLTAPHLAKPSPLKPVTTPASASKEVDNAIVEMCKVMREYLEAPIPMPSELLSGGGMSYTSHLRYEYFGEYVMHALEGLDPVVADDKVSKIVALLSQD